MMMLVVVVLMVRVHVGLKRQSRGEHRWGHCAVGVMMMMMMMMGKRWWRRDRVISSSSSWRCLIWQRGVPRSSSSTPTTS